MQHQNMADSVAPFLTIPLYSIIIDIMYYRYEGGRPMLISTKGRYVTRMLADIAMHQGSGYVPMKDVATRQQISKKYIEAFLCNRIN